MKNNKAFTLIELISTTVILSIVLFIATVLVLNIIRSVKKQANMRSIDNYGKIVETSMAEYQSQYLKYPTSIDELNIEYVGSVIECDTRRINPDNTIYLSECKVNGKEVKNYSYGKLVLTDKEYVDKLGKNIELALKDYHDKNNKYPVYYRLLNLPKLDKDVNCVSDINSDGTVYLTKCSINGEYILDDTNDDGYYHYGKYIPIATRYLLAKTNGIEITNYIDGNTHEMYTFEHDATEQTPALTDYRYIGSEPYNYVNFNNELWRIIGVFSVEDENGKREERVKLIRNESIGNNQWNSSGENEWVGSTMQVYLNETYILDDKSESMIGNAKYYLGKANSGVNGNTYYNYERGNSVYSSRSLNWTGKKAIMYPSDYAYVYAKNVDTTCYNNAYQCNTSQGGVPTNGWIFNGYNYEWFLSPIGSGACFFLRSSGRLDYGANVAGPYATRPVLYLKPNVKTTSGDGSVDSPYNLSL